MYQDKVCLKKRIMQEDTYTLDDEHFYYLSNSGDTFITIILQTLQSSPLIYYETL